MTYLPALLVVLLFCASGLPALSADRQHWQTLMAEGRLARKRHDFPAAEQLYLKAQSESKELSKDEQYLVLSELGDLYSDEGDYDKAESAFKEALSTVPGYDAAIPLAELYEIRNQPQDAKALRQKYFRKTVPDERQWLNKVARPAIRKVWVPPKRLVSQFSVVRFRLNPGPFAPPVTYLAESTGDPVLDKACMEAIESAHLVLPDLFKEPITIQFTFDYNVYDSSQYSPDTFPYDFKKNIARLQTQYQTLRERVAEQEKKLGNDHIEVAATMSEAGGILDELKQYEPATKAYLRALEILEQKNPVSTKAQTINVSLGTVLLKQKKYVDAEKHLRRAEELAEILYPAESETVVDSKKCLAGVLSKLGRKQESRALLATIPAKKDKPAKK